MRCEKPLSLLIALALLTACAPDNASFRTAAAGGSQATLLNAAAEDQADSTVPYGNLSDQYPTGLGPEWYARFGKCLLSPDDHQYEALWAEYDQGIERKVALNIPALASLRIPTEVSDFVLNLLHLHNLLVALHKVETSAWMKKLNAKPAFAEFTSSAAFLSALENPSFASLNRDPQFAHDYASNAGFKAAIDQMVSELQNPDVRGAINYFQSKSLSFIAPAQLASALAWSSFYASSPSLSSVVYLHELPRPQASSHADLFGQAFNRVLSDAITSFLTTHDVAGQSALNDLHNPVPTIAYDDYVAQAHAGDAGMVEAVFGKTYSVSAAELSTIDGVARTLFGEERGCEEAGYAQYEVVGEVIANRAAAIQHALDEKAAAARGDQPIDQQNIASFLGSASESFHSEIDTSQRGLSDFGRADTNDLPIAQVISKPGQFSVWNSYSLQAKHLSQLGQVPAGIPNISIEFKVPASQKDGLALINVLCPPISQNKKSGSQGGREDQAWRRAVDLATILVLNPDGYAKVFHATPKPVSPLLFYADGMNFSFAREQKLDGVIYTDPLTGQKTKFRVTSAKSGACSGFHAFSAPAGAPYGF